IPEKDEVANQINKRLQHILFYDDEIINKTNIPSVEKYLFIRNDSIDQSGISFLNYTYELYPNFIKIIIDIDWAGGPYPVGAETDYLQFDLERGELILMPDLIDGAKYFDFLEKFWLNDCRNSIKEAHQCAYGNETGNYESDSAYTLEGECEFQCHKMNHQFIITNDSIFISNNSNCFPHVWQNCNFGSSKYLKINEIEDYLSDYGKWLLGLRYSYSDVKPYFHFVGKIDEKYKISLSILKREEDNVVGEYFYWKQNKKILLKGQIQTGSKQIIMNELVNNAMTGNFELEWVDFLYSTEGFWYNKIKDKKLSVKLMNIYDYRDRGYNR
ncbi:MAG TPA: hypothetical protein PKN78_03470, partial [Tenuifilaceae bacterium]|nr:hypothetical protein [Tenuifilaceae bacterium]